MLLAVASAQGQTRSPEEIVVVADGCSDGTVEAVRAIDDERVRVLDLPKAPGYGWINRNEAIRQARGDLIAYHGDDDLWLPDHLDRTAELIDADVADLVQANACNVEPDGSFELTGTDWRVPEYRRRYLADVENRTPSSAVVHVKDAAMAVGCWRTVERGGDRDLWMRMLHAGVRTAATMEPTVLIFRAWRPDRTDRPDDARLQREYLARVSDPIERARLRAEISRVGLRFEADTRHELYLRNDQHAELHERFGEALAELERLRREGRVS